MIFFIRLSISNDIKSNKLSLSSIFSIIFALRAVFEAISFADTTSREAFTRISKQNPVQMQNKLPSSQYKKLKQRNTKIYQSKSAGRQHVIVFILGQTVIIC